MTYRTFARIAVLSLAACGGETAGDELPDGAFTTGPGGTDASADDDPSATVSATVSATSPEDSSTGDDADSTTTGSESDTTNPITVDESTTRGEDPTLEDSTTIDPTNEESTTTDPTITTDPTTETTDDPTTETGPIDTCGDGDPDLGEVCLQAPVPYAMGLAPSDLVLGDFDDDGALDVAVSNEDDNTVSVRFGNGDGTFAGELTYIVGTQPVALAVGRFDGDGVDDLAVVDSASDDIAILLSDGAGDFAAATFETVGDAPVDLAVVSVDALNDDLDDIVVLEQGDLTYATLVSNGDGTFAYVGPFDTSVGTPNTIVVQSDDSVSNDDVDAFVFGGTAWCGDQGDGTGAFSGACQVSGVMAGANATRGMATRFDAGLQWDVALVDDTGDRVFFLLGNGAAALQQVAAGVETEPSDVFAIDIDGDDVQDAVVSHRGADSVAIVPFDGDSFDVPVVFAAGMGASAVKSADLDGDTIPDVVTANAVGGDITVLLSDP